MWYCQGFSFLRLSTSEGVYLPMQLFSAGGRW